MDSLVYSSGDSPLMPRLHCCHCGSSRVRRASAILLEETHIHTTRQVGTKVGRYGYGVGVSGSFRQTTHTTSIPLVQLLQPPARPRLPPTPTRPRLPQPGKPPSAPRSPSWKWFSGGCGVLCLGCFTLPLALVVSFLDPYLSQLVLWAPALGAIALWVMGMHHHYSPERQRELQEYQQELAQWQVQENQRLAAARVRFEAAYSQWQVDLKAHQARCDSIEHRYQQALFRWELLCYCSQCGCVSVPESGEAALLSQMKALLWRQ